MPFLPVNGAKMSLFSLFREKINNTWAIRQKIFVFLFPPKTNFLWNNIIQEELLIGLAIFFAITIIGIPIALLVLVTAYLILPIIELAAILVLGAASILLTPLIAFGLTLWHVGKDYFNKDEIELLYDEVLENADSTTWNNYVFAPLSRYEPFSEESKQLQEAIIKSTDYSLKEPKTAFFKFFGLRKMPGYEEYNAGKGIADCLLSNAKNIKESTQKNKVESEKKQANDELLGQGESELRTDMSSNR